MNKFVVTLIIIVKVTIMISVTTNLLANVYSITATDKLNS